MKSVASIDKIFEVNKKSKKALRNEGIVDFNFRVLSEIEQDNSCSIYEKLQFIDIFFSNTEEFIQTRFNRIYDKKDIDSITSQIESSINDVDYFMKRYFDKTGLTINHDFYDISNLIQECDPKNEIWNDEYRYFIVSINDGENEAFKVFKIKELSPFIIISKTQIFDISEQFIFYIKNTLKLDANYFQEFRVIENKYNPLFYINENNIEERQYDLYDVLKLNNSNHINALLVSKFIKIKDEYVLIDEINKSKQQIRSHINTINFINKYKWEYINIFIIDSDIVYFDGSSIRRQIQKLLKEDTRFISKNKKDPSNWLLNFDYLDISKGILFESPYISYNSVYYFIHKECYNIHDNEYKIKHPHESVPDTDTIFMTIYRADPKSALIDDLVHAAKHGIKVFVYIESLARGNEKKNNTITNRLKKAGAVVVNDYYGLKVHMKAFLSIRSDGSKVAHISTGNYDFERAKTFTDYQFITSNESICDDLLIIFRNIFNNLPILRLSEYFLSNMNDDHYLYISPINLRNKIDEMLHKSNLEIFIKCNNICDPTMINSIYESAILKNAISIICRTACSLLPLYENLKIKSNTGRYLEHGRIYCFKDKDSKKSVTFISSADMLLRNLNKRLELMLRVPDGIQILSSKSKNIINKAIHDGEFTDNCDFTEDISIYLQNIFENAKWVKNKEKFKSIK